MIVDGEDKREWYLNNKYGGSEDTLQKYMKLMTSYGEPEGIHFKFGGKIANTMEAHRVVQHFQEAKGPEIGGKLVSRSLFCLCFISWYRKSRTDLNRSIVSSSLACSILFSKHQVDFREPCISNTSRTRLIRRRVRP